MEQVIKSYALYEVRGRGEGDALQDWLDAECTVNKQIDETHEYTVEEKIMKQGNTHNNLWSIVLAGGDGIRTKEFIRRWLGYEKPKQYCAFVGNRSMFQDTLDRAVRVTPWERVVVVAARHHQHHLWQQLDGRSAGTVLLQPKNMDTAAGVFLPLTYILAHDPYATVVVFPSDHFVWPAETFISAVDQAVWGSTFLG